MSSATVLKAGNVRMVLLEEQAAVAEREAAAARQGVEVDTAFRAGVADGRRAAEAAGLGAMPDVALAIKSATAGLADQIADRAAGDTATLIGYAAEIARWVLGRELAADPGLVAARIEQALESLIPNGRLVIRVAPEAVDLVGRSAVGRDAEVIGDADLGPGEARLEAGHAAADLTWAQAFDRVQQAFAPGPDDPDAGRDDRPEVRAA